ncbi:MAG: hypothetical protein P1U58_09360 [Verrucomicrobiales bacterium]|nr:hypothetical protein [Verrucomicrobiales bacterium]
MEFPTSLHRDRIIRIGKLLHGFVLAWLIFNSIALFTLLASVIGFRIAGASGARESVVKLFSFSDLVPGLGAAEISTIVDWDYQTFLDHFWMIFGLALLSSAYFVVTMVMILKIAGSLRRGELLSQNVTGSLHMLGWLYLVQGVVALVWGLIAQFVWTSNTCDLLYFSFIQDVVLYSFTFSGSGIEWGMLVLALSWIAKAFQEEQELIV